MTNFSPVIFADLDDTLFQTKRKMSEPAEKHRLASCATNGRHSYMTVAQAATVEWLLKTTRLIPTTARSSGVLARTTLPFTDFKICSNGGAIITPDGAHDAAWAERVAEISTRHNKAFSALQHAVAPLQNQEGLCSWIVYEQNTPIYFVAKINSETVMTVLDEAEERCRKIVGSDLVFHRNDRNMSFTPEGLTKIDAVEEMLKRLPNADKRPIWGMGDSMSDIPFMQICQMMVIPSDSQIAKKSLED